jgi:hypothetical protein
MKRLCKIDGLGAKSATPVDRYVATMRKFVGDGLEKAVEKK